MARPVEVWSERSEEIGVKRTVESEQTISFWFP
jgi:hypothetical protein